MTHDVLKREKPRNKVGTYSTFASSKFPSKKTSPEPNLYDMIESS